MSKFRRKIRRFIRIIKKHKSYQRALSVVMCCSIAASAMWVQSKRDETKYTALMESQRAEIVAEYDSVIERLNTEHQTQVYNMQNEYNAAQPEEMYKTEAEFIARVLYGYRNNSERDLRTVVWCILNRVDHYAYPNTIVGVCQQASQWMGYSDDNPILANLYEIAMTELKTYHDGYRPVVADYIYMSWSSKEIVLRDTFNATNKTRYWQAGY